MMSLKLQVAEPVLPYALAFAAGAMIYVVVDDIIPEAQTRFDVIEIFTAVFTVTVYLIFIILSYLKLHYLSKYLVKLVLVLSVICFLLNFIIV